jgi:hypothetical protein
MTDDNRRGPATQGRIVFRPVPGEPGVRTAMVRGPDFSRFVVDWGDHAEIVRIERDPEPVSEITFPRPCCSRPLTLRAWADGSVTVEACTPEPAPEGDDDAPA